MTFEPTYTVLEDRQFSDAYRETSRGQNRYLHTRRVFMKVKEDRVTVGSALKLIGDTKTGKKWCRWQTFDQTTFKVAPVKSGAMHLNVLAVSTPSLGYGTKRGAPTFLTINNSPHSISRYMFTGVDTAIVDLLDRQGHYIAPDLGDAVARRVVRSIYPMLDRIFPDGQFSLPSTMVNLSAGLRQDNVADMVRVVFGKTRYRKDLVRAVAEASDLKMIDMAATFRGIVPTDWIVDLLGRDYPMTGDSIFLERQNARVLREVVSKMTAPRQRAFLRSFDDTTNVYEAHDVFRQLKQQPHLRQDRRVLASRNFHEMHEAVYPRARGNLAGQFLHELRGAVRATPAPSYVPQPPYINREIFQTERHQKVDALEVPDLRFECAKDTDTLKSWGSEMGNCIGSYESDALTGRGIYVGIYKDDKLFANMELKPVWGSDKVWVVQQLLGKYNAILTNDVRGPIVEALDKADIASAKETVTRAGWGLDEMQFANNYVAPYTHADIDTTVVMTNFFIQQQAAEIMLGAVDQPNYNAVNPF